MSRAFPLLVLLYASFVFSTDLIEVLQNGDVKKLDDFTTEEIRQFYSKNKNKTALHVAARYGHQALCDHLISNYELDPKACDNNGSNVLHVAASGGHQALCDHLISRYELDPKA